MNQLVWDQDNGWTAGPARLGIARTEMKAIVQQLSVSRAEHCKFVNGCFAQDDLGRKIGRRKESKWFQPIK